MSFKNCPKIKRYGAGACSNSKTILIFAMLLLMTVLLQCFCKVVQANPLVQSKKPLKLLQSSFPSLAQLRHKRDTSANEPQQLQQQQMEEETDDSDYYDDNYDIIPDGSSSYQPSVRDQISERAKQVAQSFENMWKSLSDSIKHCADALHALFGDDAVRRENLTPEQEQELLANMEEQYRIIHEHDNEVVYEN